LKAEEEVDVLKHRVYSRCLPLLFRLLDRSIDNMEHRLKLPFVNESKRATLASRRLKTIAQFKYGIMVLSISAAEEIVRSHARVVSNEMKSFSVTDDGDVDSSKKVDDNQIITLIEARQHNMKNRSHVITKHKLPFFDEAPTTWNNTTGIVVVGAQ
jgi:hypothetical protein